MTVPPLAKVAKASDISPGLSLLIGATIVIIACILVYSEQAKKKAEEEKQAEEIRKHQLHIAELQKKKESERRQRIYQKYGHTELAEKIISHVIWTGETAEQIIDSLGHPADTDQKILKTKKKEIWKYAHKGNNRYGLKITLDNDIVVGWDEKL